MKFKVVFEVGKTKLTVFRTASYELSAFDNAKKEALEIEKKEQPNTVRLISVTQVKG